MKLSEMSNETQKREGDNMQRQIKENYEKLKDCTSEELMSLLAKEIQGQKQRGVFDYDSLRASLESLKPYFSKQSYENMVQIIESLK